MLRIYHYKVTFKPQLILPDVDVQTSTKSQDLPKNAETQEMIDKANAEFNQ